MWLILSIFLLLTVDHSYQWSILPKFLSNNGSDQTGFVNESTPQLIDSQVVEDAKLTSVNFNSILITINGISHLNFFGCFYLTAQINIKI